MREKDQADRSENRRVLYSEGQGRMCFKGEEESAGQMLRGAKGRVETMAQFTITEATGDVSKRANEVGSREQTRERAAGK